MADAALPSLWDNSYILTASPPTPVGRNMLKKAPTK